MNYIKMRQLFLPEILPQTKEKIEIGKTALHPGSKWYDWDYGNKFCAFTNFSSV